MLVDNLDSDLVFERLMDESFLRGSDRRCLGREAAHLMVFFCGWWCVIGVSVVDRLCFWVYTCRR